MDQAVASAFIITIWFSCIHCSRSESLPRREVLQLLLNSSYYDPRIAPNYEEDRATNVTMQIYILSIDSINEISMDYSMDIYLRQTWSDPRLKFMHLSNVSCLELDQRMMERVWIPDTYFTNEKKANVHTVTVPNKLLHIFNNGTVLYSVRISMTLTCQMDLHNYPLDRQICPIIIQSFGYSIENVVFNWHPTDAIIVEDLEMPQFHMNRSPLTKACKQNNKFKLNPIFACLIANLYFKRNTGFYVAQVFLPCIMIVILSWVSFWIHVDAIPARVSLGLLTVLTITTQNSGMQTSLPRVSYIKAVDVWSSMCLAFVFAALLEYAYINIQTRRHQKDRYNAEPTKLTKESKTNSCSNGNSSAVDYLQRARFADKVARVVFPSCFAVFNLGFWMYYLIINKDDSLN